MDTTTQPNQLQQVIETSGLDKTKAQTLLDSFSNYFQIAAEWEKRSKDLVITDVSQKTEMKIAREGRLFLKEKRVAVEKTRKELKEASLREGQTIDAIAKVLTNLIAPIEKDLEEKEKFAEIQEAKRLAALGADRAAELEPYMEFVPYGLGAATYLSAMDEESFQKMLSGARLQKEQKEAAEKAAEQERIAREKAEAEERERIRIENERLRKEAEAAKAEQMKLEAQLKAEREEREAKERAEARRIAAEKAAALEAERQAKNAPEKAKLEAYGHAICELIKAAPAMSETETGTIIGEAKQLLKQAAVLIKEELSKL